MHNNKNNKSKKVKGKTRTIESTTTKHHTIEEEDSIQGVPSRTYSHKKVNPKIVKQNRNRKEKNNHKTKNKKVPKGSKIVKELTNQCSVLYEKNSMSVLGSQIVLDDEVKKYRELCQLKLGLSTQYYLQKMKKDKQQQIQPQYNHPHDYQPLMQQVLSRPHEYPVLNMDGPDETDYDVKWLYEIQNYHQQQVQNWRNLQHELHQHVQKQQQTSSNIQPQLERQGKRNYKWLQIGNNVNNYQYSIMESLITNSNKEKDKSYDEVLPSYNWEKYIWKDDSESSNRHQDTESEQLINQELREEDPNQSIQERVDIILNWLIDEHVLEIVQNIEIFALFKEIGQFCHPLEIPHREIDINNINNVYRMSEQIDKMMRGEEGVDEYIVDAYSQLSEYVVDENRGRVLKSMVMDRKDVYEMFGFSNNQEVNLIGKFREEVLSQIVQHIMSDEVKGVLQFMKS